MPSGALPKQYHERFVSRVRELYDGGMTQAEIAAEVGRSQKVVWNCMRRHGIQSRAAIKRNQWGENNHAWKSDAAGKQAFHRRLYSRFGKRVRDTVARPHRPLQEIDGFAGSRARWRTRLANPSELYGGANGLPYGMDRNRAVGNAVAPAVAEIIGRAILAAERETQCP